MTDNASCKVEGGETKGLPICELRPATYCAEKVTVDDKVFCKTSYGVVLDGDTGASRPNLFMFPKTLADGTVTAEVGLGYEETKGLGEGGGKPDDVYAMGKLVRYHHYPDFRFPGFTEESKRIPHLMQPGNIVNLPAVTQTDGMPLLWEDGSPKYENARRGRFILQGKSACGTTELEKANCTTLVIVYKQGIEGQGRQSDVMMRRAKGGYEFSKFEKDLVGNPVARNISSPMVTATEPSSNEDGVDKVTGYDWTEDALIPSPLQTRTTTHGHSAVPSAATRCCSDSLGPRTGRLTQRQRPLRLLRTLVAGRRRHLRRSGHGCRRSDDGPDRSGHGRLRTAEQHFEPQE